MTHLIKAPFQAGLLAGAFLTEVWFINPVWLYLLWPVVVIILVIWYLIIAFLVVRAERRSKPKHIDVESKYPYEDS